MSQRLGHDKRTGHRAAGLAAFAAVAALGGCCGASRAEDPSPPAPSAPTTAPASLESVVALARADAAVRSGLAADAITVVSAVVVTWPDGSLGCPAPGRLYTQALVPGYRVVLQAGAVRYDYHASRRGQPSLCPEGRAREPSPDTSR